MKTKQLLGSLLVLLALSSAVHQAVAQGTAFTYQGRLDTSGNPANGTYDFRLTIYDAAINANAVGPALTAAATPVSNGLFSVLLDFGAGVFDGNPRWLGIEVRTNGAGAFTPLAPRQPLTPAPYALHAADAAQAANATLLNGQGASAFAPASGSSTYVAKSGDTMAGPLQLPANGLVAGGNQLVLSGGKVGIGTTSPGAALDVAGNISATTYYNFSGNAPPPSDVAGGLFEQANVGPTISGLNFEVWTGNASSYPMSPRLRVDSTGGLNVGATSDGMIRLHGPSISEGNIYHDATYALHLDTSGNALPIRIDGSALILGMKGNVGIGMEFPDVNLDVKGTVRASGVINAVGGLVIENRTSDPPSPAVGQIWLRTDL
jgi:hypothetical protein